MHAYVQVRVEGEGGPRHFHALPLDEGRDAALAPAAALAQRYALVRQAVRRVLWVHEGHQSPPCTPDGHV